MNTAQTVMLTGCSAGGLATYLHTDYVHEQLKNKWSPQLTKFKAAAISGFFLQHATVEGKKGECRLFSKLLFYVCGNHQKYFFIPLIN